MIDIDEVIQLLRKPTELKYHRWDLFEFDSANKLVGCCSLGKLALEKGYKPDPDDDTNTISSDVITLLSGQGLGLNKRWEISDYNDVTCSSFADVALALETFPTEG